MPDDPICEELDDFLYDLEELMAEVEPYETRVEMDDVLGDLAKTIRRLCGE